MATFKIFLLDPTQILWPVPVHNDPPRSSPCIFESPVQKTVPKTQRTRRIISTITNRRTSVLWWATAWGYTPRSTHQHESLLGKYRHKQMATKSWWEVTQRAFLLKKWLTNQLSSTHYHHLTEWSVKLYTNELNTWMHFTSKQYLYTVCAQHKGSNSYVHRDEEL